VTDDQRAKIFAKIEALLSKTTAAGATEEEAAAAAAKARELVEKYQVDLGAEQVRKEGFVLRDLRIEGYEQTFVRGISYAVGVFAEVRIWFTTPRGLPTTAWIFGLRSDVELAMHMLRSLTTFALSGLDRHRAAADPTTSASSRAVRHGFILGCARSVSDRLLQTAREREAHTQGGDGNALVKLDKAAIIQVELDARGMKFTTSCHASTSDARSYGAGAAHGKGASFGRPVKDGRIVGLITDKDWSCE
jgi:hypothetical protein